MGQLVDNISNPPSHPYDPKDYPGTYVAKIGKKQVVSLAGSNLVVDKWGTDFSVWLKNFDLDI